MVMQNYSTNKPINLHNFYPSTQPLHHYTEIQLPLQNTQTEKVQNLRYSKLKDIVGNENWTTEERELIEKILFNYQDIFHLPFT